VHPVGFDKEINVLSISTKFSFLETMVCSVDIAVCYGPEIRLVLETINLLNSIIIYIQQDAALHGLFIYFFLICKLLYMFRVEVPSETCRTVSR